MHLADDFHDGLLELVPKLRAHAFTLTRNQTSAEDLIQDTIVSALAARRTFTPGTNLAAWAHKILRNSFISAFRKRRDLVDLDEASEAALAMPGAQEDSLVLKELGHALARLAPERREALTMSVVLGMSNEAISEAMNCTEGTTKSRVSRARRSLRIMLLGNEGQSCRAAGHTGARSTGHPAAQTRS
jgi:RNA polymerase sigma-70 factor (ECF subfamily)